MSVVNSLPQSELPKTPSIISSGSLHYQLFIYAERVVGVSCDLAAQVRLPGI